MSNVLPLNIQMGALPPNVQWTPQQLGDAIAKRLEITTQIAFALFVSGSVEPSSNVGPWLKDSNTWYYYSAADGGYVPMIVEQESLGYWVGSDAPDPLIFQFWIETAVGGSPLALKTFFSGGWVDVYATTLASYATIVAMNAAIAAAIAAAGAGYQPLNANLTLITTSTLGDMIYSSAANTLAKLAGNTAAAKRFLVQTGTGAVSAAPTWAAILAADIPDISATYLTVATAASTYAPLASPALTGTPTAPTAAPGTNTTQLATTAFVQAAAAGVSFAAYPAQGVVNGQTVPINGTASFEQLDFNSATINPAPAPFNTGTFRYIAPANGTYAVAFTCQCDNAGGVAADMEVQASLYKNGAFVGNLMADIDNTPSPNGDRWSPGFSGLVALASTDYLEVFMSAEDGVNAGDLTVSAQISVHRVSALS